MERLSGDPHCPKCHAKVDAVTAIDGEQRMPEPGDVGVCSICGSLMIYDAGDVIRSPTDAEMRELADEPDILAAQAAVHRLRGRQLMEFSEAVERGEAAVGVVDDTGKVQLLETLPPEICETCGQMRELRPYGPRKPNGVRAWQCFQCSLKNPTETEAAFAERMRGQNPV
jgi:hypothetical protein